MIEILKSAIFDKWLLGLRDRTARARIKARIVRMALGDPGDVKYRAIEIARDWKE